MIIAKSPLGIEDILVDSETCNVVVNTSIQGISFKGWVKAATTENITLSNEQTIDEIVCTNGDLILVKNQTQTADNGVYQVVNNGTWTRTSTLDTWSKLFNSFIFVQSGTVNRRKSWICTCSALGTLGVDAVTWQLFSDYPNEFLNITNDDGYEQLRLSYNNSKYATQKIDSNGNLLIDAVGVIKLGNETNHVSIEDDGTLTLQGSSTTFDDLLVEMRESVKGANDKPDWDATNFGFLFPRNDPSEYIILNIQMPHRWKVGSTIFPHVHFFQNQNAIPIFKMDYRWVTIGDSVPGFTTGYTMNNIAGTQTWTSGLLHRIVDGVGISGTGKGISSMLQVKLYRDDNVYTGDCLVVSFDVHYEIDSFGSALEYIK